MEIEIVPGHRGWLGVTVTPAVTVAQMGWLRGEIENALDELARWVAYDGEAAEITICLVREWGVPEDVNISNALTRLRPYIGRWVRELSGIPGLAGLG